MCSELYYSYREVNVKQMFSAIAGCVGAWLIVWLAVKFGAVFLSKYQLTFCYTPKSFFFSSNSFLSISPFAYRSFKASSADFPLLREPLD